MDTITTRRARASDSASIAEVAFKSYLPYVALMGGQRPAPMDADYAGSIARDLVWVAEVGVHVAGFLVLVDQPAITLLENVAVHPDWQGRGIGRLLIEIGEDHAKASGRNAVRLYTNAAMLVNRRLYSYLGYVEVGRRVEDGFDRVFYEKSLDATEKTQVQEVWPTSTVPVMTSDEFVPVDFDPPTSLATNRFHLEPLGPQHNQADHAAWMSSIEHIRSTPGYPDGNWPPRSGMTLEENLADLRRHADDFTRGAGYTFTVLDPGDNDVIGCVYIYPSASEEWDVTVQSWVRADRSSLDVPLADSVARWLATDWPWERVDRCGR